MSYLRKCDCVILGAGAAGLTAAWRAAQNGLSVILADSASRAGNKVRIAGGGKGNVTNKSVSSAWFVGECPDFCDRILKRYGTRAIVRMLEALRIPLEERDHGQLFCKNAASGLVEALVERCRGHGAEFLFSQTILSVEEQGDGFGVRLEGTSGELTHLSAPTLVIALGSPACPQIGATDFGYALAKQWGHRIVPPRPALSPFIFPEQWPLHGLAGISLPVRITVGARSFVQDLLFTHKGLSGPAALHASCFWRKGLPLEVDFLPAVRLPDLMHAPEHGKLQVHTLLARMLPERLVQALIPDVHEFRKVAEVGRKDRERIAACIHTRQMLPARLEGFSKAEAAAGGVDTRDLDPGTLESLRKPGLFFAGEVLDVTGLLGGYNLHWAWASGLAAGEAIARRLRAR